MDFSLTTLFVVPSSQSTLPTTGSTQNLTAGQFGIFDNAYELPPQVLLLPNPISI